MMVNNSTNINQNHLSHLNSLSDGQQFHQYQQKSPLIFVDIGGIVDHHSMSLGKR
jgi:hypothetical protein